MIILIILDNIQQLIQFLNAFTSLLTVFRRLHLVRLEEIDRFVIQIILLHDLHVLLTTW